MAEYGWITAAYGAIALFIIGVIVRIVSNLRMPVHLRWELAPVPGEGKKGGGSFYEESEWWTKKRKKSFFAEILFMAREIFFLHGVWRGNRLLWPFSYAFHVGLYFLVIYLFIVTALVVVKIISPSTAFAGRAMSAAGVAGGIGYIVGSLGAAGLLALRALRKDLRTYTSRGSLFNLMLCGAVLVSGLVSWSGGDVSGEIAGFIGAMIAFAPAGDLTAPFTFHLGLTLFFVALLPYTQMIHFVMKFFTYHKVLWDDREKDPSMERRVAASLEKNVTWAAPHAGGGSKRWVDAVQEVDEDDKKDRT